MGAGNGKQECGGRKVNERARTGVGGWGVMERTEGE